MKFVKIKKLTHDIIRGGRVVIPAGSRNVEIAYRSACWTFINDLGVEQRGNVYRYKNKTYY
jgi:hypothetical protein